jgi:flavin-binding protein dodecin
MESVQGTSLESFDDAARAALAEIPPKGDEVITATVERMSISRGGITPPQYHVELAWARDEE